FSCSLFICFSFFLSSRRRHTRSKRDWSSDVCSSDLIKCQAGFAKILRLAEVRVMGFKTEVVGLTTNGCDCILRSQPGQNRDVNKIGRASCRERAPSSKSNERVK